MTTIQVRRGSAAQAASSNPTLAEGELGFETDTGKFKIGDGTTVWNALPYATDASRLPPSVVTAEGAGDPRLRRVTAPYLRGQVAVTRCGQPHQTVAATAGAFTGRVAYTTGPVATADLRFCFSNWVTMPGGSVSEGPPGQSGTIKAAIEIPRGGETASFPLWFAGQRSVVLDDGAEVWSDPSGVELPAGASFWVRVLYSPGGSGTVYPQANIYSTAADSWVPGDSVDGTGALSRNDADQGLYRPTAITGTPLERTPQVAIVGDERAMGTSAAPNYLSYFDVAFAGNLVTVNLGADQDRASWFAADHAYRGRFLAGCDYAIESYGGKDLDDGAGLAAIQAARITIWQLCKQRGLAVYADTIPPYTSSTDGWTTTTNQTKAWGASEPVRVALNQWLRAGAPMASGVAVAPGASGAVVAGQDAHPLAGTIDDAAQVETQVHAYGAGTDSGIWKVGAAGAALTDNGYGLNVAGCQLAANAVPVSHLN